MAYAKRFGKLIRYTQDSAGAPGTQRFKVSSTPTREQWAEQVVQHFLNVNGHLFTLDRQDEWSTEGIDYSKTWSNDGLITPWRFQGRITDLMIPEADWDSPNVNSDGYWQPDVDANLPLHERRRLWGLNTPEMDKIYHRLMGSEKYTVYKDQYSYYSYSDVASAEDVGTFYPMAHPDSGNIEITKTKDEVANYYWNKFGYEGGLGNNTSNWLYPLFIKKSASAYSGLAQIRERLDAFTVTQYSRMDVEGMIVEDSYERLLTPNLDKVDNITYNKGFFNYYAYYRQNQGNVKGDNLVLISRIDSVFSINAQAFNVRDDVMRNFDYFFFTKEFLSIRIRSGDFNRYYPLPSFRGYFQLAIGTRVTSDFFKIQETVPLSRANLILGDTAPGSFSFSGLSQVKRKINDIEYTGSFQNITTVIRGRDVAANSSGNLNFANLDITRCPNIASLGPFVSNSLRIDNCPKLDRIEVIRNNSDSAIDIQINNGIAERLNEEYVNYFRMEYSMLTTIQVDAIIKCFHKAVITDSINEASSGVIKIDGINNSGALENRPNSSPSQSVIDTEIAALSSAGWTIYHN